MGKDAYYFSHDSNAKDDPKCVMLIDQLGLEGYGIYWILVETLREQKEYRYPMKLLPSLARRFGTTVEKVKATVQGFGLFEIDENDDFFSLSLLRRMELMDSKREQARAAVKKRWDKTRLLENNVSNTDVLPEYNVSNTMKVKEKKRKESKVNKIKLKGQNIFEFYEEVIHRPNILEKSVICEMQAEHSDECIAAAIDKAKQDNIHNITYVETILNNTEFED